MKKEIRVLVHVTILAALLILFVPSVMVSNAKSYSIPTSVLPIGSMQYSADYGNGTNMVGYYEGKGPTTLMDIIKGNNYKTPGGTALKDKDGNAVTASTTGEKLGTYEITGYYGHPGDCDMLVNRVKHSETYYAETTWAKVNDTNRTNKFGVLGYMLNCDTSNNLFSNPCALDITDTNVLNALNFQHKIDGKANTGFTIEIALREFKHLNGGDASTRQSFILSLQTNETIFEEVTQVRETTTDHAGKIIRNGSTELIIFYTVNELQVKYPGSSSYLKYTISEAELQNSTITLTVKDKTNINLYVNGKQSETGGDICSATDYSADYSNSTGNSVRYRHVLLGNNQHKGVLMHGTYTCLRFHAEAINQDKAKSNFELDKKWFYCRTDEGTAAIKEYDKAEGETERVSRGIEEFASLPSDWRSQTDWTVENKSSANLRKSSGSLLALEDDTVYLKNTYKWDTGVYKVGTIPERLMVTGDIQISDNSNVDFCGMVIDYSDKVYSLLDERREEMYFNSNSNTSPFSTGVGFNLILDGNTLKMRVFVAGDGYNNATKYTDIDLGTNTKHNYTIYRSYEDWQYISTPTYNSSDSGIGLRAGSKAYVVRFYVDKKLKAVVGMHLDSKGDNYRTLKFRGGLFSVSETNGNETLSLATDLPSTCTFGDWIRENWYGVDGEYTYNHNGGDSNDTEEVIGYIGTPSGNVLMGIHLSARNDSTLVYFDEIGYMDYNDLAAEASTEVTDDMDVHVDYNFHYSESKIPDAYFNRLGYNSSTDTYNSIGSAKKDAEKPAYTNNHYDFLTEYTKRITGDGSADFNAAHGVSSKKQKVGGWIASVDGVFFRDIGDDITYDFVDHNGVVIHSQTINLLDDYFLPLFNSGKLNDAQKNFLVDLIELGRQESLYTRYNEVNNRLENLDFSKTFSGAEHTEISGITKTKSEMSTEYGTPSVDKTQDLTGGYSFKSYNISLKSYIGLLVSVNIPEGKEWKDHLKVYKGSPDDGIEIKIGSEYSRNYAITSVKTEAGVVTVEIPLKILDYGTIFTFVLTDEAGNTNTLEYSLYKYCAAKWETTSKGLNNYVKRLYHVGELAKKYNGES